MRVNFGLGGLREPPRRAGSGVIDEQVARAGVCDEPLIFREVSRGWWRELDLIVGEFAQTGAVAMHDVGIDGGGFFVRIPLPLEVDALAIVRPAYGSRFVTDQARAAHDVVDRQGEVAGRAGLQNQKHQQRGGEELAHQNE